MKGTISLSLNLACEGAVIERCLDQRMDSQRSTSSGITRVSILVWTRYYSLVLVFHNWNFVLGTRLVQSRGLSHSKLVPYHESQRAGSHELVSKYLKFCFLKNYEFAHQKAK